MLRLPPFHVLICSFQVYAILLRLLPQPEYTAVHVEIFSGEEPHVNHNVVMTLHSAGSVGPGEPGKIEKVTASESSFLY
jgi:hypothetical protein